MTDPCLLILDRDGVLNEMVTHPEHGTVDSPLHPSQLRLIPGTVAALLRLQAMGHRFVIASNQPAAAKGKTSRKNLETTHEKLLFELREAGVKIEGSYICYHRAEERCRCRKPSPGLLEQALNELPGANRSNAWMIGDGLTDIAAGKAAGVKTALLAAKKTDIFNLLDSNMNWPDLWCHNLAEFADMISQGTGKKTFSRSFIAETAEVLSKIDTDQIEKLAVGLADTRESGGRLFLLGVGGSAGHAGHATNDFRKICGIEAYAPTDNVSELTARVNDEGWDTTFSEWLKVSRLGGRDAILIFSVGGGNAEKKVSMNIVRAIELARETGAKVFGIVGRDGGFTKKAGDAVVVIPPLFDGHVTPHTEGLCAVVWHLLVSHPALARKTTKWESLADHTGR